MEKEQLSDIQTEQDIRKLVDEFYAKVIQDKLLGPVFNDIAKVDWGEHLPTMYNFWGAMLLGSRNYKGMPFPPHAALYEHISPAHFARWIELFHGTLDEYFEGPVADTAKQRSLNISYIFQSKLAAIPFTTGARAAGPQ